MAPMPQEDADCMHTADGGSSSTLQSRSLPSVHHILKRALIANPQKYDPGRGVRPPQTFNNKGYFALFAILGAAMVVVSIWFFFWAKNGGFVWQKGDWDDYKSTVLRRKDANGKTLTNATPPTNLGEKSIAGTWDIERDDRGEMTDSHDFGVGRTSNNVRRPRPQRHGRENSDEDLRAYRRERSAKVGGLNREEDGSHFASSNASRSDVASEYSSKPLRPSPLKQEQAAPKKGFMEKKREKAAEKRAEKAQKKEAKKQRQTQANHPQPSRSRHTFAADEVSNADLSQGRLGDPNAYLSAYRPPAPPHAASRRHEQASSPRPYTQRPTAPSPRQPSPTKPTTSRPQARYPGSFDAYSDAGSDDTGTRIYTHHIPNLGRSSRDTGFQRGMAAGRWGGDSDSDDDDMAGFRRR